MSDLADGSRVMTTALQLIQSVTGDGDCKSLYVSGCSETALARYGSQSLPVAHNGFRGSFPLRSFILAIIKKQTSSISRAMNSLSRWAHVGAP